MMINVGKVEEIVRRLAANEEGYEDWYVDHLTIDQKEIEPSDRWMFALECFKECLSLCQRHRKVLLDMSTMQLDRDFSNDHIDRPCRTLNSLSELLASMTDHYYTPPKIFFQRKEMQLVEFPLEKTKRGTADCYELSPAEMTGNFIDSNIYNISCYFFSEKDEHNDLLENYWVSVRRK